MTEHVHEWYLLRNGTPCCSDGNCGAVMVPKETMRRLNEYETLKKATDEMRECLGFFASVIKSGEPWTDACEKAYADILEEIDNV